MKDKVFFQTAIDPWPCGILTGEFSVALISQNGVLLKCLTIEVGFLIRGAVCWAPKVAAGAYSWALGCTQDYFPVSMLQELVSDPEGVLRSDRRGPLIADCFACGSACGPKSLSRGLLEGPPL